MEGNDRRRLNRLQATSEVVIATGVVLAICYFGKLPLMVLLVSILVAFVLAPIVELLERVGLPRALGSFLAVLLFVAVIYGLFYVSYTRAEAFAREWPYYEREIRKIIVHVRHTSEAIQKTTTGAASPAGVKVQPVASLTQLLAGNLGPITELIFEASFIPFLVFFMLTWQEHLRSASVMLFKVENRNTAYVTLGLISSMIRSFIVANVLVGLFISAVSTAVFAALRLPYFYFIGFISGFVSLVPYLGVVLALLPPLVAGLGQIHSTGMIVIVVTVLGLHLFSLNVLYPKFLGSRLHLNPFAATLALLFWEFMWGPMGLILAIPITAAIRIIFDHVERLRAYGTWLGER